ncbi:biotin--[acetyl-CoA-carboxylase] ligase [Yimella sp. cx-573]|nr:biotin--[acetyl-CoA-carboxylase] ligase [Yimella sp. cx-573]
MAPVLESESIRGRVPSPPWRQVDILGSVDSTNAVLTGDPKPWRVVTANYQSSGRGRLDRQWEAPEGTSIALSASLPLPRETTRWGWVPLLVGVAVRRALLRLTDLDVGLKWPNDVLVRTRDGWLKVGGILCEATHGAEPVVVVGIGLNVWQTKEQLPVDSATSLMLNDVSVHREVLIEHLLAELVTIERVWHTSDLDGEYRTGCVTLGQVVRVTTERDAPVEGEAVDIDEIGRLVIEQDGERVPQAVGDVVHVRPKETAPNQERPTESSRFVDQMEERLLGNPRSLRRADVGRLAGVDAEFARRLWRAMGFANARDEDVVFNRQDVEAVRGMAAMVRDGLINEATAIGIARAVGRSTDRMSMWMLQLISDMLLVDEGFEMDRERAAEVAERTVEVADRMTPLVDYVTRRAVSNAIARMVADAQPESHVGVVRTVGFADLVNFSHLIRSMSERDLALLVTRFETIVSDVVAQADGAVVKTVGDEVLFTHRTVEGAVQIGFDLLAAVERDPLIPRLRVGVATGRVLARQGDIYGNTVNRASRLTSTAAPGEMLVDEDVAAELRDRDDLQVFEIGPTVLQGVGEVHPCAVSLRRGYSTIHEE